MSPFAFQKGKINLTWVIFYFTYKPQLCKLFFLWHPFLCSCIKSFWLKKKGQFIVFSNTVFLFKSNWACGVNHLSKCLWQDSGWGVGNLQVIITTRNCRILYVGWNYFLLNFTRSDWTETWKLGCLHSWQGVKPVRRASGKADWKPPFWHHLFRTLCISGFDKHHLTCVQSWFL